MELKPELNDKRTFEKYSSAFTLSDMEIFIFPELFYPLVLANIMSPIIWKWRDDPWFKDIHKKSFNYRINRIKQYIMDHYVFNLDLETWGLTTKEKELERFKDFMDIEVLQQSNALFGYEGDKYYFDIDIRKHFGLDKYTTNVIPYWKTETIEAMTAFKYKVSHSSGAGECVSLSALYAAAFFIIGRIPLEKIFLIATPLHSQNFVAENDGVLTNNRRIVTKNMWFNGTALSSKARRALENEKVTIISHISGYIHTIYPTATINSKDYMLFSSKLNEYLNTNLTPAIFINFLRYDMSFKKCFQYIHLINGREHYIALEKIFEYEHLSKHNFSEKTRPMLLNDIETEDFSLNPLEGRMCINTIEKFLIENKHLSFDEIKLRLLSQAKESRCDNFENITLLFAELKKFIHVKPELPILEKQFIQHNPIVLNTSNSREEIIDIITNQADDNETARLTLYVYRQMDKIDWNPFIVSGIERNPVSLESIKNKSIEEVYHLLTDMPEISIYDSVRLAQPDEVWNFGRGDGIEKALFLINFIVNEFKSNDILLSVNKQEVFVEYQNKRYSFRSSKNLTKQISLKEMF